MALNLDKAKIGRKILAFAAICGVLGAFSLFQPLSLALYALQTKAAVKPVSGDIIIVGIDSASINKIGRWPWPRDKQAELLRQIDSYGPSAVYIDIGYQGRTTASADEALRTTLENMNAKTKVIVLATRTENNVARSIYSNPTAVGSTPVVSAFFPYLLGFVWELPTMVETDKGRVPSMAASVVDLKDGAPKTFAIDFTLDPKTVPVISAERIFERNVDRPAVEGKIVILGVTDPTQNDIHSMPGWGDQPGVMFHVLGAETLKNGIPRNWGWAAFFVVALAFCASQLTNAGLKYSKHLSWGASITILGASTLLVALNIGNDPVASVALIGSVGMLVSRQKAALIRSQRHASTGMFNMAGYMVEEVISNALFIGATLTPAETRLGYLRKEDEVAIMKEVGHRISTVIDEQQITHNDNQQFLWEMPVIATHKLADHLEGLRQMFAEPLLINGRKIDIDVNFGVDRNVNNNIKKRMETALEASVEASKSMSTFIIATTIEFDGILTSQFDSEFETAINNGDIELVLEPHKNLNNGRIEAASAALRWTHPAYGQIDTAKLFAIARETNNLNQVTSYLSAQAMKAAGELNRNLPDFTVSVKMATALILNGAFLTEMVRIAAATLCQPKNVTLELVDLHEYKFNDQARRAVREMQRRGFRIAVGNFGMTDADIDFIKKFEPDEIVLAKSFSAELLGSKSNEIFAVGALRIAKASNVIITADGIDDRDVLAALQRHGCDRCKGKIIHMSLNLKDFLNFTVDAMQTKVG
jgi:EAL domain-containing protein (putative c-di-GMP-specific phosphodiesterase class I)/CHASE2 domain-containing sensor protein